MRGEILDVYLNIISIVDERGKEFLQVPLAFPPVWLGPTTVDQNRVCTYPYQDW